jgi:hypothetical protein
VETGLTVDGVSGFGLVEDELGARMVAKSGELHGRAHQVAGELNETDMLDCMMSEFGAGGMGEPRKARRIVAARREIQRVFATGAVNPLEVTTTPWCFSSIEVDEGAVSRNAEVTHAGVFDVESMTRNRMNLPPSASASRRRRVPPSAVAEVSTPARAGSASRSNSRQSPTSESILEVAR